MTFHRFDQSLQRIRCPPSSLLQRFSNIFYAGEAYKLFSEICETFGAFAKYAGLCFILPDDNFFLVYKELDYVTLVYIVYISYFFWHYNVAAHFL
ncbi:hypothetical protein Theco_4050 (plasmid) [Thermobacillus composti KWC4]|uniref:Uncharacterized protein n=1 Tax=Thermobacillus composti (strain DSM 18247 / JCM 13945 / KWC4) TaxID=717605 RepID=L0EJT6_THECK|nr:hypothetical protein Theco_4050 [Thermobacillus composti KWC4]